MNSPRNGAESCQVRTVTRLPSTTLGSSMLPCAALLGWGPGLIEPNGTPG
jgi:hypothetical protein